MWFGVDLNFWSSLSLCKSLWDPEMIPQFVSVKILPKFVIIYVLLLAFKSFLSLSFLLFYSFKEN